MTLAALLKQPVTVEHRSATSTDPYGNEVPGTTSSETVTGYVEQTQATEIEVGRETYVTTWLVVLPGDVIVDGSDRIVYDTAILQVVGEPHRTWNPRSQRYIATECRCVEVRG